jgi:hypothetical protein
MNHGGISHLVVRGVHGSPDAGHLCHVRDALLFEPPVLSAPNDAAAHDQAPPVTQLSKPTGASLCARDALSLVERQNRFDTPTERPRGRICTVIGVWRVVLQ